ncbi:TPA: hypothetical protein OTZ50_000626, partial [Aeromonas hydrophila]|nr:hypothetical protein [Aeromonas hydrophila]
QRVISTAEDFIAAVKSSLLTKSDEWIYEKEHRFIIPFACSTSFSVNTKNINTASSFDKTMTVDVYIEGLISKRILERIDENEYTFTTKITDAHYLALSSFGCISFLYEIDQKHIHSIHAGLRFPDDELIKLHKMICDKKSKMSHVKLYRFKMSTKRFELLPEIVDDNYISNIS